MIFRRKKIVIHFGGQPGDAGSPAAPGAPQPPVAGPRRGIGRILMVIAVVLLLMAGGVIGAAYLWWSNFQSSPAYSLALLADAAQRNDTAAIDKLFDTDQVTNDFVEQVRQRIPQSVSSSISSSLPIPLTTVVPVVAPKLRQTVHDECVKELQRITKPAAGKPFILVALAASRFLDIKQEGKTAHIAVNIEGEKLELTMQEAGDRWRIVAVRDDELAKRIAEGVVRSSTPSSGTQFEDEIRRQLEKFKPTQP